MIEVEIYRAKTTTFAEIIKNFLESNGIFAYIRADGITPYFGDSAPASIYVKKEDQAVAKELIREFTL